MMIRVDESIRREYGIALYTTTMIVKVTHDYDIEPLLSELRHRLDLSSKDKIKDNPVVRALRDFYWRLGIDPTKVRPSSEALLRRFLSNGRIPRINNVVDAGNIASIETLVPIGIYDLDKINGSLVLRSALKDERFIDISGNEHVLTGKEIVLADDTGIVHLFPHRDALRTSVKDDTTHILIVGCSVDGIEYDLARYAVNRTVELINVLSK
jgi:DNA/RNA-binding domain of Phe-tRNA-synthetase-like protein